MVLVLVEEKMKNKYLIVVTNDDILKGKVKEEVNFLFPVSSYSVGFKKTYDFDKIDTDNAFLFINRILDNKDISLLEQDLSFLNPNIKGICFTDLGVLKVIKKLKLNIITIYMQSHNTTNYKSVNYYLEYVDSLLVSTDITELELIKILDNATKPLVLPYFLLPSLMYSRRKLLENYQSHFSLPKKSETILHEDISKKDFLVIENDYGTVFYPNKYADYRHIKHKNILYYYINPLNLELDVIEKILRGEDLSSISDRGFLNIETYYNLKEDSNNGK